jgi:hypothetical protein
MREKIPWLPSDMKWGDPEDVVGRTGSDLLSLLRYAGGGSGRGLGQYGSKVQYSRGHEPLNS